MALAAAALAAGPAHAAPSQADASGSASASPDRKPDRRWIDHRVVPHESIPDIARRYGVTEGELRRWNKKRLGNKGWIYAGRKVRIYARKFPPPREKIAYEVQRGDSWSEIAAVHNVEVKDLRAWNKKVPRAFKAGTSLTIWTNPVEAPPAERAAVDGHGSPIPEEEGPRVDVTVKPGALSVGSPNRGRLVNGIRAPNSDLYDVRDEDKAFGSSHAIDVMTRAIATFRHESGYRGKLYIGAISLRNGGRFRPHKSHQSGRDIDIRLPRKPGYSMRDTDPNAIDWRAAWALIKAFADSDEVEYIFLSTSRQRRLLAAARAAGASVQEREKIIQYPRKAKTNNGLVRHAKGHTAHIHVRVKCASDNPRCQ